MSNSSGFIELTDQELKAKTGSFCNPVTGTIWELSITEGKLLIQVPNFSFPISPLTKTKFRPVNIYMKIEFEFEKLEPEHLLMHIYAKGVERATFAAL